MIVRTMMQSDCVELALMQCDIPTDCLQDPRFWLGLYVSRNEVTVDVLLVNHAIVAASAWELQPDGYLCMLIAIDDCIKHHSAEVASALLHHIKARLDIERPKLVVPIPLAHGKRSAWRYQFIKCGFHPSGTIVVDDVECEALVFELEVQEACND